MNGPVGHVTRPQHPLRGGPGQGGGMTANSSTDPEAPEPTPPARLANPRRTRR